MPRAAWLFVVWALVGLVVVAGAGPGSRWAGAQTWQPLQPTVRDRGPGGVTVTATWEGVRDGAVVLRLSLDTHSVDLSGFDVLANTVL
ncbi:MAG: hypothetical protein RMM30_00005, partial [Armatimonadota bacterium]|nr:hypothetical protein [Armatimonadota bacterium]MDW8154958.1 hypothetical protein [Armatimonadota bacterium]